MGYDVHITRKVSWFDEEGPSISLAQWRAVVDADPEMRLDDYAEAQTAQGAVVRVEGEGLSVWLAYSGHGKKGNMAWFDFRGDRVTVKNPDREILTKMHALAQRLSARVQGDEGEEYDASGNQLAQEPPHASSKRPWWKFWTSP